MGIELNQIIEYDPMLDELLCKLCGKLPENAVVISNCEHILCQKCADDKFEEQQNARTSVFRCPIDGRKVAKSRKYGPPPRIVRNILDDVAIRCENHRYGCQQLVTVKTVASHRDVCECGPHIKVECEKGCGIAVEYSRLADHNCMVELRKMIDDNHRMIDELNEKIDRLVNISTIGPKRAKLHLI